VIHALCQAVLRISLLTDKWKRKEASYTTIAQVQHIKGNQVLADSSELHCWLEHGSHAILPRLKHTIQVNPSTDHRVCCESAYERLHDGRHGTNETSCLHATADGHLHREMHMENKSRSRFVKDDADRLNSDINPPDAITYLQVHQDLQWITNTRR
jgi:hypothetical protein